MRRKKDWTLTGDTLDHLLTQLDGDRDRAGEKYERIRRKLVNFFQWRRCLHADEYADRTIDRVAHRLSEAVILNPENPYLYFHGVALNLLSEYWRAAGPVTELVEAPAKPPEPALPDADRKLECLNRCLEKLTPGNRDLLVAYHNPEKDVPNIQNRKSLADTMNVPLNALRIRVFRIRDGLRNCVEACMSAEMDSGKTHNQ